LERVGRCWTVGLLERYFVSGKSQSFFFFENSAKLDPK